MINQAVRILIGESQHAAPGVFDQHDLLGPQKLLGDDDAAQCVLRGCSGLLRTQERISSRSVYVWLL